MTTEPETPAGFVFAIKGSRFITDRSGETTAGWLSLSRACAVPLDGMQWLAVVFIVLAGVLNALQTGFNAQLAKSLGQPGLAAPIVFLVGLAACLVAMPFFGTRIGDYQKLAITPWWAFLGGLCGAVFIYAMLTLTQQVGAGVFVAGTVTASVVTSVAIDHFGALGVDPHPATLWRIAGVVLMLCGVALVGKF